MFDRVDAFVRDVSDIEREPDLREALAEVSKEMGFSYFALAHHLDMRNAPRPAIRLHNYPGGWEDYFEEQGLGRSDPVHRASQLTTVGFAWSRLPRMIQLTRRDQEVLGEAGTRGIGDGFTVPAHVPGEINGSCSFATATGAPIRQDCLALAQLVGAFAFEAARRLARMRDTGRAEMPRLTDRQRDCVVWAARGKTDWEIARILGVSHDTVIEHLRHARQRYGVGKRAQLTVHALFDGSISFVDVLKR
jgi:LuxR family quorum-sensing system transcriptional regulator CciR